MRKKKEINIQIGERVKSAREKAKFTQEQLAEFIDVTPQYISDLERGVVGISIPTLKALCLTLGISSDSILYATAPSASFAALAERCCALPADQFQMLTEMVQLYLNAIESERNRLEK